MPKAIPFGERLRALREARGWTQEELGRRAGLAGKTTVWRLEAGQHQPAWPTVLALANALGVTVGQLHG